MQYLRYIALHDHVYLFVYKRPNRICILELLIYKTCIFMYKYGKCQPYILSRMYAAYWCIYYSTIQCVCVSLTNTELQQWGTLLYSTVMCTYIECILQNIHCNMYSYVHMFISFHHFNRPKTMMMSKMSKYIKTDKIFRNLIHMHIFYFKDL